MILASANFGLSYILEIVALFLVAAFIARYVAPFLNKMMNAKLEQIRTQLAAGEQARAEAAALVEQRRSEVASAKTEASGIVEQARRAAETLRADGERRASEEYDRLVARAHAELAMQAQRVRTEVASEMGEIILAGTKRLVDAELDSTRHRSLINTAISAAETENFS